jgi:hypothetical protein
MLRNFWLCNCPEENSMALDLPEPVAEYLAAEKAKDLTRFPVVSPKMALSTTRGRIITVVTQSANGSRRRTRNTDTSCRQLTFERTETW